MAYNIKGFFFKSKAQDRKYLADEFVNRYRSFLTDGIFGQGVLTIQYEVLANGSDLNITVGRGIAHLQGYFADITGDEDFPLTLDPGDVALPRIDSVVLQINLTDDLTLGRTANIFIRKGTPASVPVAPTLTQDIAGALLYEVSIADISVIKDAVSVAQTDVVDNREKVNVVAGVSIEDVVDSVNFVRMTAAERSKFIGIVDGAEVNEVNSVNGYVGNVILASTDLSDATYLAYIDEVNVFAEEQKFEATQLLNHVVTPSNPVAGKIKIYAKSDNKIYVLNSAGTETPLGAGGASKAYAQKTNNYTVLATDNVIEVTSGDVELTMHTAVGYSGTTVEIKNSGNGLVKILPDGYETLDGKSELLLGKNQAVELISDNTNWKRYAFIDGFDPVTTDVDTGTTVLDTFSYTDSPYRTVFYEFQIIKDYNVQAGLYIMSFTDAGNIVVFPTENLGVGTIDVTLNFDLLAGNIRFTTTSTSNGWKVTVIKRPLYMDVPTSIEPASIGYWFGGVETVNKSTIDGIDHQLLTQHVATVNLSIAKYNSNCGNSAVASYIFAGLTTGVTNLIKKMVFGATETISTITATVLTARYQASSGYQMNISIWINGGYGADYTTLVEKFNVSLETMAANATNLAASRTGTSCASNATHQVVFKGRTPSVSNTCENMDFATGTFATLSGTFATAVYNGAATGLVEFAVLAGGYTGSNETNTVEKFIFATNTKSTLNTTTDTIKDGISMNHSTSKAFLGGDTLTEIEIFDKTLETFSVVVAGLSVARFVMPTTQSGGI